jgi:hypothetical protein
LSASLAGSRRAVPVANLAVGPLAAVVDRTRDAVRAVLAERTRAAAATTED